MSYFDTDTNMPSYKDLLKQRAALDAQIAEARQREIADAVAQVKAIVAQFGLQEKDVFAHRGTRAGRKIPPKYRDPATGKTWTGRGKAPRWLDGKNRDDYLIR